MVSEESLKKFKEIFKKEFRKELSDEEAMEQATKLLRLVELVYKPITQEEYDRLRERKKI